MPMKKYLVTLDDDGREQLEHLLHRGTHATRKVTRARILLKAAEGAEFVAAMEDVLEVSAEPYDPTRPKVNVDKTNQQRIQETRQPLPA